MNKKIIALITSFLMIASAATPAFAEAADTTVQTAIVQDSQTVPEDAGTDSSDTTTPEVGDDAVTNDADTTTVEVGETEDESDVGNEADEPSEELEDDVPSDEDTTTVEVGDEDADTANTAPVADTAASDNDALLGDEEEYYADKDWMSLSNGVLTIKGEIKDIGTSGLKSYWEGVIDVTQITQIKTVSGAKAPAYSRSLFYGFSGLKSADLSNFDTSNVTNMIAMFRGCSNLTSITGLSTLDTSKVTTMSFMFADCKSLSTVDVSGWNTGNVTTMDNMFYNCSKLTSVTGMYQRYGGKLNDISYMYQYCTSLKSASTPYYATAKSVNLNSIFDGCSNLTYVGLYMNANTSSTWTNAFSGCSSLNRIYNWRGTVTIPSAAALPNSNKERWYKYENSEYVCMSDGSTVANFIMLQEHDYYRFAWYVWDSSTGTLTIQGRIPDHGTSSIPQTTGITASSIKKVTTLNGAHTGTSASDLFYNCSNLASVDLSNLNVASCTNFTRTFCRCPNLTSVTMPSKSTGTVTQMQYAFADCSKLTSINLSKFVFSTSFNNTEMFRNCSGLTALVLPANFKVVTDMKLPNYSADYGYFGWKMSNNASSVSGTGEYAAFNVGSANTYYRVQNWFKWDSGTGTLTITGAVPYTSNTNIVSRTGVSDISASSVKKITAVSGAKLASSYSASHLCDSLTNLTTADLSNLDTSNATSFYEMFDNCTNLTSVSMSGWSTSNVNDVQYMFYNCAKLSKIDMSSFNVGKIPFADDTKISGMFSKCSALNTLVLPKNFIVTESMKLTNKSGSYIGWAKSGNTVSISGTGDYASFTVGSNNGTYVRVGPIVPTSVSLNKTSLSLTTGGSEQLTATVLPSNATDKSITWMSANPNIATVSSSGVVKGVKAGYVVITAKTSNGKTATCTVTVSDPVVNPTGVTLNRTSATLNVGGTITLIPTVSPSNATNKSITWNTSSSSIATVSSSGVVTAKAEGTATITASTFNGKSATCTITVNSTVVDPTSVTLDKTAATVTVGATTKLTATIKPDNATNHNVTWTSSDTSVATVSNGVVTGVKAGTATITAKATAKPSVSATCVVTVKEAGPDKPTVVIKTAFGGKTVQFNCTDPEAEIYYQTGSSNITLSSNHVAAGETVFFNTPMTGSSAAIYFKAYKDGKWSVVGKWGLLNVKIAQPLITQSGKASDNNFRIYTQTKDSYIIYTMDGTIPSIEEGTQKLKLTNGKIIWGTSSVVNIPKGKTIKAIAIRNGLVTSDVLEFTNE